MYYKTLTSALLVGLSGASPLAVAEPESQNSTSLDSRAVLNTQLYAVYNTEKWATTVARKSTLCLEGHVPAAERPSRRR